ncbi:hypothetical protein T4D_16966 [Trichinella pseudospiralis]|uniref:Uncharacterized protein n=1 Tax=Trichinella pseudospiralis TaxID=6337 RepID=A0A0V1FUN5_TRIPS|nr:hypothetical protein T4D_16966 [Trichinella pseudospiralis]
MFKGRGSKAGVKVKIFSLHLLLSQSTLIKQTYKRVLILEYSISTKISPDERMLSCETHLRLTN